MTRLRLWLARFRLAWRILRHGADICRLLTYLDLFDSPYMDAARFAVQKGEWDTQVKIEGNELLRREGIEWMGHWLVEYGHPRSPWHERVCLELAVGDLKGRFGTPPVT